MWEDLQLQGREKLDIFDKIVEIIYDSQKDMIEKYIDIREIIFDFDKKFKIKR